MGRTLTLTLLLLALLPAPARCEIAQRERQPRSLSSPPAGGEGEGAPGAGAPAGRSILPATVNGFTMTVATEVGDKTFCIAAVMAMRYNRLLVFSGAASALLVMTVLSVAIGVALPALLPKQYTHYAAAALFAYFGVKLLMEARAMPAEGSGEHSELADAEEELEKLRVGGEGGGEGAGGVGAATPTTAGAGSATESDLEAESDPSAKQGATKRAAAAAGHYLQQDWAVLTQAFTITFLAEWGDRSQIATIAMAAAQHPVGGALPKLFRGVPPHSTHSILTPTPPPPRVSPLSLLPQCAWAPGWGTQCAQASPWWAAGCSRRASASAWWRSRAGCSSCFSRRTP